MEMSGMTDSIDYITHLFGQISRLRKLPMPASFLPESVLQTRCSVAWSHAHGTSLSISDEGVRSNLLVQRPTKQSSCE